MPSRRRLLPMTLMTAAALTEPFLSAGVASAQISPATQPAVTPATQPGPRRLRPQDVRPVDQIGPELAKALDELAKASMDMPSDALFDPAKRAATAPRILPAARRVSGLYEEIGIALPAGQLEAFRHRMDLLAYMAMLGDADALLEIKKFSVSPTREEFLCGQAWLLAVDWALKSQNAPEQEKILQAYTNMARANADNDLMTQIGALMRMRAAAPAMVQQVEAVITDVLNSQSSRALSSVIKAERRLQALLDKPLVIEGQTADGQQFSSAGWKGKVVLVDFWGTWVNESMRSLPALKKFYADYHAKGVEIVGVSNDKDPRNFRAFLADNKDMPWPQLIDPAGPDWHPLMLQLGVPRVPTMFLIDRNGICRSVTAKDNYEEEIKKLLAEK